MITDIMMTDEDCLGGSRLTMMDILMTDADSLGGHLMVVVGSAKRRHPDHITLHMVRDLVTAPIGRISPQDKVETGFGSLMTTEEQARYLATFVVVNENYALMIRLSTNCTLF